MTCGEIILILLVIFYCSILSPYSVNLSVFNLNFSCILSPFPKLRGKNNPSVTTITWFCISLLCKTIETRKPYFKTSLCTCIQTHCSHTIYIKHYALETRVMIKSTTKGKIVSQMTAQLVRNKKSLEDFWTIPLTGITKEVTACMALKCRHDNYYYILSN